MKSDADSSRTTSVISAISGPEPDLFLRVDDRPALDTLAVEINAEHAAAERTARTAIDHARAAGNRLLLAKAQVEHGQWLPWLSANCPALAARTARSYMQLARNWETLGTKTADSANLSIDAALKLLNAPEPETIELITFLSSPYSTPPQPADKQRESKLESLKTTQHDEIVSKSNLDLPQSPVEIEDLRQEHLEQERFEANRAAFYQNLSQLLQGAAIIRNPSDCNDPAKWRGTWDAFHSRYGISDHEARERLADLQARIPFLLKVIDAMQNREISMETAP